MLNYFTIAQLTDRLPDRTGSVIATDAQINTKVRMPAVAWVDSVFPYDAPFADVEASPATPMIVQMGALEYGIYLARVLLTKDPQDKQGQAALSHARRLFQIDSDGLARVNVHGVAHRLIAVDITRSYEAEARDEADNQRALWP